MYVTYQYVCVIITPCAIDAAENNPHNAKGPHRSAARQEQGRRQSVVRVVLLVKNVGNQNHREQGGGR